MLDKSTTEMSTTFSGVSADQVFRDNGFVTGIRVLDDASASRIRRQFDELEAREGTEKAQIGLLDRHFDQPFIYDLATNPVIVDRVEQALGSDVLLLATHFFCKYGGSEKQVAWHQDVTYWNLDPPVAATAWYAIDDSDQENGCMRVIPGTHLGGIRQHGKSSLEGNLLSVNQAVSVTPEEEAVAVDLPLKAGEMSIHDGRLIHGSLSNRSNRRRCGLTLRYIPKWVKIGDVGAAGRPWRPVAARIGQ